MVPMLGLQPNAKNWSKETFKANPVKLPERNLASQLQQADDSGSWLITLGFHYTKHACVSLPSKHPKTKRADP